MQKTDGCASPSADQTQEMGRHFSTALFEYLNKIFIDFHKNVWSSSPGEFSWNWNVHKLIPIFFEYLPLGWDVTCRAHFVPKIYSGGERDWNA